MKEEGLKKTKNGYIEYLAVTKEYEKTTYAKNLLMYATQKLFDLGCTNVWTMNPENNSQIELLLEENDFRKIYFDNVNTHFLIKTIFELDRYDLNVHTMSRNKYKKSLTKPQLEELGKKEIEQQKTKTINQIKMEKISKKKEKVIKTDKKKKHSFVKRLLSNKKVLYIGVPAVIIGTGLGIWHLKNKYCKK